MGNAIVEFASGALGFFRSPNCQIPCRTTEVLLTPPCRRGWNPWWNHGFLGSQKIKRSFCLKPPTIQKGLKHEHLYLKRSIYDTFSHGTAPASHKNSNPCPYWPCLNHSTNVWHNQLWRSTFPKDLQRHIKVAVMILGLILEDCP